MAEFLKLKLREEAQSIWFSNFNPANTGDELVGLDAACGRVTAQAVLSPEPSPPFSRSTMDGYAVKASQTYGASEGLPAYLRIVGEVPMGRSPDFKVGEGEAAIIHTGGMLPPGTDAVVMIENTQQPLPSELEVLKAVAPAENMVSLGEDIHEGEEIISNRKVLRAVDIGGMASLGITQVRVVKKPRLGILSSGDEVVPYDVKPQSGQVRDINSHSLAALIRAGGGEALVYDIIPDQGDAFKQTLKKALEECDGVVVTAGSSASVRDLTAGTIQAMGEPGVLVHGINIRPGKPTILGVCNGKPVIGLPGNPVSAYVIALLFVNPMLDHMLGLPAKRVLQSKSAVSTTSLASVAGREEWIPVRLLRVGDELQAEPTFFKSSLIFSLARADGLLFIPAVSTGIEAGETVEIILL